jgi:hypothetical protein
VAPPFRRSITEHLLADHRAATPVFMVFNQTNRHH